MTVPSPTNEPKVGSKVIFTNKGGWPSDRKFAQSILVSRLPYKVVKITIDGFNTKLWLEGHIVPFNAIMFEVVEE